jgi:peptide/nickel transport system substrate-binding protein
LQRSLTCHIHRGSNFEEPTMKSLRRPRTLFRGACAVIALSGVFADSDAFAGKADDTLNLVFARETDSVDRIHTNSRESQILSTVLYDSLLYGDPQTGKFGGLLASGWKWVDDTTLEFDLRPGVKFHNGETFDADDVVYTTEFVMNPANKLRQQEADFGNIKSIEKLSAQKVRITFKKPDPMALYLFANRLIMWPNEYTASQGHQIHMTKPIGTGPYTMQALNAGKNYRLARNDTYTGGARPKAAIKTINARVIAEVQTQMAEFMVGQNDLSFDIPAELAESLTSNPQVVVAYGGSTRYTFLSLNAAGRNGNTPLQNQKVRQAISHAIDRKTIASDLVRGGSVAINAHCNPNQEMCLQDVPGYGYDPQRAKQLLAEAGYPNGFEIGLMSSSDLKTIGTAVQGYLGAVGVRAKYEMFTLPAWRNKLLDGESQISLLGWGGGGGYGVDYALGIFFDQGTADYARDSALSEKMKTASSTMDAKKREQMYREILTRINEQAYNVPLFGNGSVYVMSKDLNFTPPRLDSPDLTYTRWK